MPKQKKRPEPQMVQCKHWAGLSRASALVGSLIEGCLVWAKPNTKNSFIRAIFNLHWVLIHLQHVQYQWPLVLSINVKRTSLEFDSLGLSIVRASKLTVATLARRSANNTRSSPYIPKIIPAPPYIPKTIPASQKHWAPRLSKLRSGKPW